MIAADDRGPGIVENHHESIFEIFNRGNSGVADATRSGRAADSPATPARRRAPEATPRRRRSAQTPTCTRGAASSIRRPSSRRRKRIVWHRTPGFYAVSCDGKWSGLWTVGSNLNGCVGDPPWFRWRLRSAPGSVERAGADEVQPTSCGVRRVHDDYDHVYRRTEWDKVDVSTYHGGAIGDELGGLLAPVLGIRLRCGGTTRIFGADWTNDPRGAPGEFQHHRPSIVRPRRNYPPTLPRIARESVSLPSAQDLLNTYPTLPRTDAIALVRAARQYEQAVWISDADPGVSWLQLVSAIEIAAVHWREYRKGDVFERVGFANSSGSLPPTTWLGSALLLSQVEGGLLALVVRVSRRAEPVRACLAAGAPASLEGARDPGTAP